MEAILARGCFSVARLIPLLEARRSPVAAAADLLVCGRASGQAPDEDAVITLSDYLEASEWRSGSPDPRGLEYRTVYLCLILSGLADPAWSHTQDGVLTDSRGLWRTFDDALPVAREPSVDRDEAGPYELRETNWQELEQSLFPDGEASQLAVSAHFESLMTQRDVRRTELALACAERGWQPAGPCSLECDWPTCRAESPNCIEGRRREQTIGARLRRKQGTPARAWYLELLYYDERPDGGAQEQLVEISAENLETRKIGYFSDGVETADANQGSDRFSLSADPVPSLQELSARPELVATEISPSDFEDRWRSAR